MFSGRPYKLPEHSFLASSVELHPLRSSTLSLCLTSSHTLAVAPPRSRTMSAQLFELDHLPCDSNKSATDCASVAISRGGARCDLFTSLRVVVTNESKRTRDAVNAPTFLCLPIASNIPSSTSCPLSPPEVIFRGKLHVQYYSVARTRSRERFSNVHLFFIS